MSLFTDIREKLDETSTVFWPDAQVYDAANEAQMETWVATKWTVTTHTLTATTSAQFCTYNPTAIMVPHHVLLSGRKYFITDQAKLEQFSREWRSFGLGQPRHFVLWDAASGLVRPFPRPDAAYNFSLVGLGWPPEEIAAGQLDITAPALLKDAIVLRACATLLEYTQPVIGATMLNEAEGTERDFRRQLNRRLGHNIARLRPAAAFNHAQSGVLALGRRYH